MVDTKTMRPQGSWRRRAAVTGPMAVIVAIAAVAGFRAYGGPPQPTPSGDAGAGLGSKVIGGGESSKKVPFLASIQSKSTGGHICTGALISPEVLLTATHCFGRLPDTAVLQARIGSQDRTKGGTLVSLASGRAVKVEVDIALVFLAEPVKLPVAELAESPAGLNQKVLGMGWGVNCTVQETAAGTCTPVSPEKVKEMSATVIACPRVGNGPGAANKDKFNCVKAETKKDEVSVGDSGGPLLVPDGDALGGFKVAGTLVGGATDMHGSPLTDADGLVLSSYTNVPMFRDKIQQAIDAGPPPPIAPDAARPGSPTAVPRIGTGIGAN